MKGLGSDEMKVLEERQLFYLMCKIKGTDLAYFSHIISRNVAVHLMIE